MLDKFTYTNHLGEVITFGDFPYFANESDMRDYQWSYDADLTRFERGTVTKQLQVYVVGNYDTAIQAKDRLYEIIEKDVLAMKKGTFQIGDYKMNAYVYGSSKSDYLTNRRMLAVDLAIVTDTPQWKSEQTFSFVPNEATEAVDYDRDYFQNRGYPYGYMFKQTNESIDNDSFFACGFRLIIYGAVTNPMITIGGNIYRVDVTVAAGEYLEIISDGTTKTITLHKAGNVKQDCFAYRYKPQSVFTKIESGIQDISWNNEFGFDLILLKERSEPKWTL